MKVTVAVIDDERPALDFMVKLLASLSCVSHVDSFHDPQEALNACLHNRPDVVFLDIEMPVMSGLHIARELISEFPNIDIVFVTAHSKYALLAFETHASDYLLKPVNPLRLQIAFDRIINRRTRDKQPIQTISGSNEGGV
ncbi:MAG: hypothetical protein K0R67_114 [Paenibacillus sp.]|nr:hypothetical protein [Paenibacillus sp.]